MIIGATRPTRPPRHPAATLIMAASVSHTAIHPTGAPVGDESGAVGHPPALRPAPNSAATVGDYMVAGSYFYTPRIITRSGMGEEKDRVVSVAAGAQFTFGITRDGSVLSWGWDAYGCLGRGGDRSVMDFESVPALRGIRASSVSPGADHVLCITEVRLKPLHVVVVWLGVFPRSAVAHVPVGLSMKCPAGGAPVCETSGSSA
jgi:hypothetical protein